MTVEVIHAGGRATQSNAHFGSLAAAIDNLERISGERIGGPTDEELAELAELWARIYRLRPSSGADWKWCAGKLAQAHVNGWCEEAYMPLERMVGDPLTVGC